MAEKSDVFEKSDVCMLPKTFKLRPAQYLLCYMWGLIRVLCCAIVQILSLGNATDAIKRAMVRFPKFSGMCKESTCCMHKRPVPGHVLSDALLSLECFANISYSHDQGHPTNHEHLCRAHQLCTCLWTSVGQSECTRGC